MTTAPKNRRAIRDYKACLYFFYMEINDLVFANKCGIQHSIVTGIRKLAPGVRDLMLAQLGMTSQASLQRRSYPSTRGSYNSVSTIEPPRSCLISSCRLFAFFVSFVHQGNQTFQFHRSHPTDLFDGSSMSIFDTANLPNRLTMQFSSVSQRAIHQATILSGSREWPRQPLLALLRRMKDLLFSCLEGPANSPQCRQRLAVLVPVVGNF